MTLLTDCNNVYKAMSNDKDALAAIELKYGKEVRTLFYLIF